MFKQKKGSPEGVVTIGTTPVEGMELLRPGSLLEKFVKAGAAGEHQNGKASWEVAFLSDAIEFHFPDATAAALKKSGIPGHAIDVALLRLL